MAFSHTSRDHLARRCSRALHLYSMLRITSGIDEPETSCELGGKVPTSGNLGYCMCERCASSNEAPPIVGSSPRPRHHRFRIVCVLHDVHDVGLRCFASLFRKANPLVTNLKLPLPLPAFRFNFFFFFFSDLRQCSGIFFIYFFSFLFFFFFFFFLAYFFSLSIPCPRRRLPAE